MRRIEIFDDVLLRFPGRDAEFDVGLEVGAMSVLIAQGIAPIRRDLSLEAVEQLRPIAAKFGYTLVSTPGTAGMATVTLSPASRRPLLRIVGD